MDEQKQLSICNSYQICKIIDLYIELTSIMCSLSTDQYTMIWRMCKENEETNLNQFITYNLVISSIHRAPGSLEMRRCSQRARNSKNYFRYFSYFKHEHIHTTSQIKIPFQERPLQFRFSLIAYLTLEDFPSTRHRNKLFMCRILFLSINLPASH